MASLVPCSYSALVSTTASAPLKIVSQPMPTVTAGKLLINVRASSINPVDVQLWKSPILSRLFSGDKGFGKDFSGVVVKVGEGVKGWKAGDSCCGLFITVGGAGTVSEYILIDPASNLVVKKPVDLSHTDAASIPLVALTAMTCLEWLPKIPVNNPQRVIIRGASGGCGIWGVQIAKSLYHCHVTAICSGPNVAFVKALGADEVIDYTKVDLVPELLRLNSNKYDLFIDNVGGTDMFPHMYEILHPNAAYVSIVGDKTNRITLGGPVTYLTNPAQIIRALKGMVWGPRYGVIGLARRSSALQQVIGLLERGEAKGVVQEVFQGTLSQEGQWEKAIDVLNSGRVRGKIVLEI